MNPATFLRVLGPEPWRVAYAEPSVRPDDSRYGENPNRLQMHTQYQVILKPDPVRREGGGVLKRLFLKKREKRKRKRKKEREKKEQEKTHFFFQPLLSTKNLLSPGKPARALLRFFSRPRHRRPQARRPLRRGQLGEPGAGRLGPRLGSVARRPRGHSVYLLSGCRRRAPGRPRRRDHLRAGEDRHCLTGGEPLHGDEVLSGEQ
jgi:hypothetical protein